ncbi:MAG TPA: ABC transporter permease subunit, partial [Candidatus Pygmaiobacter gallistercoris]|nr:ABC transporter permease subunit [Candidatus Pygmaiobacter gallistercoris]
MKRTNLTRSPSPLSRKWNRLRRKSPYLLMLFPAVLVVFLFSYLPIYGILIAFQDFMPGDKILSDSTIWVGFYNFKRFFSDPQFWPLMKNTFLLCIIGFLIGFPFPIIVALSINALKGKRTSKFLQTIFTAPHFISLVVLVGMLQLFFGRYGLVNNIVANLGGERFSYFLENSAFRPLYILSSNWQDFGWSAIIYIAALSNVDPQQHEAAKLDGATRFQRVLYVDIPAIMPIISV